MTLEVSTGGLQVGTGGSYTVSGITLTGGALRSTYNGEGVIPASQATAGFAITSNYNGLGEVDFWSLVNGDHGFAFLQKTAAGTAVELAAIYGDATYSEYTVSFGGAAGIRFGA